MENKVHWVLDVIFREDEDRTREGHVDENKAIVRHTTLNICRLYHDHRKSLSRKRLAAAWSEAYLNRLLGFETRLNHVQQYNGFMPILATTFPMPSHAKLSATSVSCSHCSVLLHSGFRANPYRCH
jgi:hypothetical protein